MDFVGFGKSDKYADIKDYSFDLHLSILKKFIESLHINEITLVVHDGEAL